MNANLKRRSWSASPNVTVLVKYTRACSYLILSATADGIAAIGAHLIAPEGKKKFAGEEIAMRRYCLLEFVHHVCLLTISDTLKLNA